MTQCEFTFTPPYPKRGRKDFSNYISCLLKIEDPTKLIDFSKGDFFFEAQFEPCGGEMGSVNAYLSNVKKTEKYIFTYVVQWGDPFKFILRSYNDFDLSNLKVELISVKENPFNNVIYF